MHEPMVQRADSDLIVWLIVVGFTLVSQMMRAAKQKPRQRSASAPPPNTPRPPMRRSRPVVAVPSGPLPPRPLDLQTILEQLAGRPAEAEFQERNVAEPPEPVEDPLLGADPDAVVRRQPPPPPTTPKKIIEDFPALKTPSPAPIVESKADPYAVGRRTATESALMSLRASMRVDMREYLGRRKAVLLRELLDPPLALRPSGRGGI